MEVVDEAKEKPSPSAALANRSLGRKRGVPRIRVTAATAIVAEIAETVTEAMAHCLTVAWCQARVMNATAPRRAMLVNVASVAVMASFRRLETPGPRTPRAVHT